MLTESATQALSILRDASLFQWYVIPLFAYLGLVVLEREITNPDPPLRLSPLLPRLLLGARYEDRSCKSNYGRDYLFGGDLRVGGVRRTRLDLGSIAAAHAAGGICRPLRGLSIWYSWRILGHEPQELRSIFIHQAPEGGDRQTGGI